MGYSQRAATLEFIDDQRLLAGILAEREQLRFEMAPSRCLIYKVHIDSGRAFFFNTLYFESVAGGFITMPTLFKTHFNRFIKVVKEYEGLINLPKSILRIRINFMVAEDEEFFANYIQRPGQKKLYDRILLKSELALQKLTPERLLIVTSGIAKKVDLYK